MLKGSDSEVKMLAKQLVSARFPLLLVIAIPVVGLPGCALGVTSAMGIFVYPAMWQKLFFLIGIVVGLGTPVWIIIGLQWLHRIPARSLIRKIMAIESDALAQCFTALSAPSYFNATSGPCGGAIAVDPVSKKVALVFGQMLAGKHTQTRCITLDVHELKSCSAEQPGVSTLSLAGSGHSSSDMLTVHSYNQEERVEQRNGTGLRIITENLDATEIFMNFDYEVAKSWVVLLDKFSSGRLEVPSSPTEFPKS